MKKERIDDERKDGWKKGRTVGRKKKGVVRPVYPWAPALEVHGRKYYTKEGRKERRKEGRKEGKERKGKEEGNEKE